MLEKRCRYQSTMFDLGNSIYVSSCCCTESPRRFQVISSFLCDNCPHKVEPTPEDIEEHNSMFPGADEQRSGEEQETLLATYCFKCRFLDKDYHFCSARKSKLPIEEYVAMAACHCPFDLW